MSLKTRNIAAYYNKSILSSAVSRTDSELENKVMVTFLCNNGVEAWHHLFHSQVKKTSERICENLHIIANEPSLAFYRIAEHVRKVSCVVMGSNV